MARAKPAVAADRPAATRRSWFLLQGLTCGVVAATAAPLAVVAAVLLAPWVLVSVVDRSPNRELGRVVLVYAVAAGLPFASELWRVAASWPAALAMLGDPQVLAIAWGAQALAWLLSEVAPLCCRLVLDARASARTSRLRAARARLEDEWGLPPAPQSGGASDQNMSE